jgi:hypothetical protein
MTVRFRSGDSTGKLGAGAVGECNRGGDEVEVTDARGWGWLVDFRRCSNSSANLRLGFFSLFGMVLGATGVFFAMVKSEDSNELG